MTPLTKEDLDTLREPEIACNFCQSNEVVWQNNCGDSVCQSCGEWQDA